MHLQKLIQWLKRKNLQTALVRRTIFYFRTPIPVKHIFCALMRWHIPVIVQAVNGSMKFGKNVFHRVSRDARAKLPKTSVKMYQTTKSLRVHSIARTTTYVLILSHISTAAITINGSTRKTNGVIGQITLIVFCIIHQHHQRICVKTSPILNM